MTKTSEREIETISKKDLWGYSDLHKLGYGCPTAIWKKVKSQLFVQPIDYNGTPKWIPDEVRKYVASRPRYVMEQPEQLREYQQQHCVIA